MGTREPNSAAALKIPAFHYGSKRDPFRSQYLMEVAQTAKSAVTEQQVRDTRPNTAVKYVKLLSVSIHALRSTTPLSTISNVIILLSHHLKSHDNNMLLLKEPSGSHKLCSYMHVYLYVYAYCMSLSHFHLHKYKLTYSWLYTSEPYNYTSRPVQKVSRV